jgi:hypothetical protein
MARPLKNAKPLSKSVTFRLTEKEFENLSAYAWRYDIAPSDLIRDCLDIMSVTGITQPSNKRFRFPSLS